MATATPTLQDALERYRPLPEDEDDVRVDARGAAKLLGCDVDDIDRLRAAGLPARTDDAGPRFRRSDVLNLGLASGTGRTVPEMAERYRMRFVTAGPEEWTGAVRWDVALAVDAAAGEARVKRPEPERFGGAVHAWPDAPLEPGPRGVLRGQVQVTTRGAEPGDVPEEARALYDELLCELEAGGLRYAYLPERLRRDPDAALRCGVVDCLVATLHLERGCRDAGLRTRTRLGLLLGMSAIEHAWLEVENDDGRWCSLDPTLAGLAARTPDADPRFRAFACGGTVNRLLPWDVDACGSLVEPDARLEATAKVDR